MEEISVSVKCMKGLAVAVFVYDTLVFGLKSHAVIFAFTWDAVLLLLPFIIALSITKYGVLFLCYRTGWPPGVSSLHDSFCD